MSIQEFFRGRNVFITGATGFMGKVLVEKLARSCPGIGKICILVRHKKGKDLNHRIKEILDVPLFDTIKEQKPGLMEEKLLPLKGDMTELRLGLSDEDYDFLVKNVSVIFHVAASVRFDESIKDATIMNVRGTREVVQLAKQVDNLAVLLHVSTAYCNCIRENVKEKIYEAPIGWREMITIAENLDPAESSILTKKLLGTFPNTYTLTKLLAEQIINDERNNLPLVLFRPSIVISSASDPIKGWIDNFNGPIGLMVASGKGVVRVTYGKKSIIPDYMAVDISIKSMITAAWYRTVSNLPGDNSIAVYNSASVSKSISNEELITLGMKCLKEYPFEEILWYPSIIFTNCFYYFYIISMLTQVLPAICLDKIMDWLGKPHRRLLPIQQKIYVITMALSYFTTQSWKFENKNFLNLIDKISEADRKEFNYNFENIEAMVFLKNAAVGAQKYLFNIDHSRLPIAKRKMKRYMWINRIVKTMGLIVLVLVLIRFNIIPSALLRSICCFKSIIT
ncbi:Male sterility, NAD-binding,NAD(P)-binding domain,Fatty acyl-CoA reductase, C-terminal [Cinara cedri]|uniref:Fatty acyl-CoA reductase n=1 Tax=Cinara cedri TaxID=506608 RepID=A0A5E4MH69_9HEMI|nr:Male sterility, NAD-binding,NAD(P)-binding domain,Fatty acyl-CoA reductase, C-terminal [Cinara cedri]